MGAGGVGRAVTIYFCGVAELVGLPELSGRPAAIHCSVRDTGLDPTCKYTPSSGGVNFPYWDFAASRIRRKIDDDYQSMRSSDGICANPQAGIRKRCRKSYRSATKFSK